MNLKVSKISILTGILGFSAVVCPIFRPAYLLRFDVLSALQVQAAHDRLMSRRRRPRVAAWSAGGPAAMTVLSATTGTAWMKSKSGRRSAETDRQDRATVTRHEAVVLAYVHRLQPLTPYRVQRHFEDSLLPQYRTSANTVYSIIKRLSERGLIQVTPVVGDSRNSAMLTCTPDGARELRNWVGSVGDEDLILEDPIRTKMMSLELLPIRDRVDWMTRFRDALVARLSDLEDYASRVKDTKYHLHLHDNARSTLMSRLAWASRVLAALEEERLSSEKSGGEA